MTKVKLSHVDDDIKVTKGHLRETSSRLPKKAADKKFQVQNNLAPFVWHFVMYRRADIAKMP